MEVKQERIKQICGTCAWYDSGLLYCPLHGEKFEEDTCDDWKEDEL